MPMICYMPKTFQSATYAVIEAANQIIAEYAEQGFQLTLRQLYYQFVARDLLRNQQREYKRLGSIVNDGRLAGLIDWSAIEDRTRNLHELSNWTDPAHIIDSAADGYREDLWQDQPFRVEVWIEKEALAGVFQRVCDRWRVPFFSCRGYTSQSEMWSAARRLIGYAENEKRILILHFGDHDPSGIDMTRDIEDRLALFGVDLEVDRLALNMVQVDSYEPPPNPAKITDSRFAGYLRAYGRESWELDALEPALLADLVRDAVKGVLDGDAWEAASARESDARATLDTASARWAEVAAFLANGSQP